MIDQQIVPRGSLQGRSGFAVSILQSLFLGFQMTFRLQYSLTKTKYGRGLKTTTRSAKDSNLSWWVKGMRQFVWCKYCCLFSFCFLFVCLSSFSLRLTLVMSSTEIPCCTFSCKLGGVNEILYIDVRIFLAIASPFNTYLRLGAIFFSGTWTSVVFLLQVCIVLPEDWDACACPLCAFLV